jgi:hypothetical protein
MTDIIESFFRQEWGQRAGTYVFYYILGNAITNSGFAAYLFHKEWRLEQDMIEFWPYELSSIL